MKHIRLEITREQWTTITVAVPDDFDESKLRRHVYHAAVRHAIEEFDATWEEDALNENLTVDKVEPLQGEAAAIEFKDYGEPVDITAELATCEQEVAASAERIAAFKAERKERANAE